jgi:hypothetical protein
MERHGVISVILKGKKLYFCGEQRELFVCVFGPQDAAKIKN